MSADVPVFMFSKDRYDSKASSAFTNDTRSDIKATLDFLLKRGMFSSYHHKHWLNALGGMHEEMLHLWWDSIVGGSMFEMDSPHMEMLEAKTKAMEEMAEEKVEMKMGMGNKDKHMKMKSKPAKMKM